MSTHKRRRRVVDSDSDDDQGAAGSTSATATLPVDKFGARTFFHARITNTSTGAARLLPVILLLAEEHRPWFNEARASHFAEVLNLIASHFDTLELADDATDAGKKRKKRRKKKAAKSGAVVADEDDDGTPKLLGARLHLKYRLTPTENRLGHPYRARRDSAEDVSRLNAQLFTVMARIFIPAHCFALP